MVEVNYCPQCGEAIENPPEPFRPYIDCEECDQKIYMEVWTYD